MSDDVTRESRGLFERSERTEAAHRATAKCSAVGAHLRRSLPFFLSSLWPEREREEREYLSEGGRALALLLRCPLSPPRCAVARRRRRRGFFLSWCSLLSLSPFPSLSLSLSLHLSLSLRLSLHPPDQTHRLYVLVASMHQKSTWWKRTTWVFSIGGNGERRQSIDQRQQRRSRHTDEGIRSFLLLLQRLDLSP